MCVYFVKIVYCLSIAELTLVNRYLLKKYFEYQYNDTTEKLLSRGTSTCYAHPKFPSFTFFTSY